MSKFVAGIVVCLVPLLLLAPAVAQNQTFFNQGNLVVSVEGCGVQGGTCTNIPYGTGNGSGNSSNTGYGDNQAAPLTLFQFELNPTDPTTVPATFVNSLALPQTASGANVPVSGEYGSSSEGTLQLAGPGQYLTIMGYGVNANAFNADPTLYGNPGGELAQSGSLTGQTYTPVPRVTTLIDPYGNVNSSTAIFNTFNGNNPRSTYTADGINIYVSGQGTSGDNTGGVFLTTLGPTNAPTTITGDDGGGTESQDTRTVQIYNDTLYVSMDSKTGAYNRSYIGTLGTPPATSVYSCGSGCPTGDGTIGPALMPGFGNTGGTGRVKLTAAETNGINVAGEYINLSPENYFFASPTVLYVADSGSPKNTSADNETPFSLCGAGGLQKWVNESGTWTWVYTLYQGLNLVQNANSNSSGTCSTNTSGTTGLIGLTGVVVSSNVYLYAINYTIADLDPTYLYGITDVLSATTNPGNETFTQLAAAPSDSNFKGVAFVPTLPAGSATITSSPSGLAFTSTGTGCAPGNYTTPVTLIWTPGNSCTLSVASPQTASGATYTFAHWQDGTTNTSDTVTAPTTSAVYTASFTTTTSIAVTSVSPSSEAYGQDAPVTITAALSWAGNGPAPTASDVTIGGNGNGTYGTTSCGSPSGDSMTCTATYTPSTNDVAGTYTETATFSGDSNYSGSSSAQTGNFAITSAGAGTITVSSSGSPSTYGASVTFTASIPGQYGAITHKGKVQSQTVTGTVTWSSNTGCGTTDVTAGTPGTASCTTSVLPVGSDTVTASYSGDANHNPGSGSTLQTVNQASTTINVTSVSPAAEDYGEDATVSITAVLSWTGNGAAPTAANVTITGNGNGSYGATSCGAPSGNAITCTNTYSPTTADTPGSYTESATFSGDTNYTSSSSSQTNNFTINSATSSTAVSSSLNPSNYQQSVTFTATITGEYGNVKGRVNRNGRVKSQDITGSVTWSSNTGCGTTPVADGGPGNPGTATCTTSSLPGGTDTITATYNGDGNHSGSTGTLSPAQMVNPLNQTITFSMNAPSSAVYNASFNVAATASSQLTVAFTAAGSCSVVDNGNGTAAYTMTSGTGTCSVMANQAGNNDYNQAPQVTQSVTANKATQNITVTTPAPSTAVYGSNFTVVASASSGLPLTYTSSGACSNTGGGATYTITSGTGTCTEKLSQAGNSNYTAAANITETTQAQEATQTVSFTGAPSSASYGSSFTVTATSNAPITPLITTSSQCSANGDVITITAASGACTMTATWNGNGNYKLATATQSTVLTQATPTVTWNTPAPISYGTALSATQLNATATGVNGGSITGTFKYTPASGKVLAAGSQTLSVTFTPTGTAKSDYTTAAASVTLQVNQDSTITLVTSNDQTVTLSKMGTATATVDFDVSSYKPTGQVTLTASPTGETCSGTVSVTGSGSCRLTFTSTGTRTIVASYPGDANHTASNNSGQSPAVTITVNPY
jgi:hypothetical protein